MSEPIRVLNLFTIMNRGGAETMVMNYYRQLDKSKIQFDFMVHRQERGAYDDEIEAMGGRIYRMCPIQPQYILTYKRLLKEFFHTHTEFQILHSHMSESGVWAFKEAIKHQIPVRICHAHSSPNFKMENWLERGKSVIREIWAKEMRHLATDFFVCSKSAGEWLFGKQNEYRFVMMNNAIDAAAFAYNQTESEQKKQEMNWNGKIVIGHVGRLIQIKNQSFLIDIFQLFHQKHPESILVLIGDGEEKKALEAKTHRLGISKSVQFLGMRADTRSLYKALDLFVFPSLYEGLPVSLVEAQAAGLPCITSDTFSKQARILPSYIALSLQDKPEIWVEQMEKSLLLERKDTRKEIIEAGFDIEANAEWLTQYYINRLKS